MNQKNTMTDQAKLLKLRNKAVKTAVKRKRQAIKKGTMPSSTPPNVAVGGAMQKNPDGSFSKMPIGRTAGGTMTKAQPMPMLKPARLNPAGKAMPAQAVAKGISKKTPTLTQKTAMAKASMAKQSAVNTEMARVNRAAVAAAKGTKRKKP